MEGHSSRNGASPAKPSISAEINAGTRSLHAQLNRLIIGRLPLCLPPHTNDPTIYALGLRHFAHIFLTFESLFADISATYLPAHGSPTLPSDASAPSSPRLNNPALSALLADPYATAAAKRAGMPRDDAILAALGSLLPPDILRSAALHTDLTALHQTTPVTLSVALSRFPSPAVQDFVTHIRAAVADRPHVLVAYSWVFFMALFSGGRWIRSQLVKAGADFWRESGVRKAEHRLSGELADDWDCDVEEQDEPKIGKPLDQAGLSFLFFAGDEDGEDIKAAFKARLAAAEGLFSANERNEIVEEAREIFRRCIGLIHELDEIMGTPADLLNAKMHAPVKDEYDLPGNSLQSMLSGLGRIRPSYKAGQLRMSRASAWKSQGWLEAAGRMGTVVVLGSAAWLAFHYVGEAVLDSPSWTPFRLALL